MRKRGRGSARRTERRGGGGREGSAQPAAARVPVAWCRSLSLVLRARECVPVRPGTTAQAECHVGHTEKYETFHVVLWICGMWYP